MLTRVFLLAFALSPPQTADRHGDFVLRYDPPAQAASIPVHARMVELDLLAKVPELQVVERLLVLPAPIVVRATDCAGDATMYLPQTHEIKVCYALLQVLWERGERLARLAGEPGVEAYAQRYVWANLRFILAHEIGHALIEALDLPVTGRIEDAVDQFASLVMQQVAVAGESRDDVAWNLRMAATDLLSGSRGQYPLEAYADAHALGEQRYFNLQCLLYGSDQARFADLVEGGDLPAARARSCPEETRRATRAWWRLLQPYLEPAAAATMLPRPRQAPINRPASPARR